MAELLVALAPLLALAALALAALLVPLEALAVAALVLVAVGLALGVPTGLTYHVLLRRALVARGALPKGWYWQPQRYHAALDPQAVRQITPWFLAGALGFLLIMLGLTLSVTALVLWLRGEGQVLP